MSDYSLKSMDLVRLADQIDADRELGWQELQSRDYGLGQSCTDHRLPQRLLCWLDRLEETGESDETRHRLAISEASLGYLFSALFLIIGIGTMIGFLFGHSQGLINVLWFFAFFILFQVLLWLFSAITLALVASGNSSASFTFSPTRVLFSRALPERRYWRDFQSIFQLAFLRYGQGMGIGFISGALLAFLLVPALNEFGFIWSSTFNLGSDAVLRFADMAAMPWAHWLPGATVDADTVEYSRYHPGAGKALEEQLQARRGWWSFLFVSMVVYVLLPRLLLWLASRWVYARRLRQAFLGYPGVDLVLRRMTQPTVHTQARRTVGNQPYHAPDTGSREGVLLISWGGAIAVEEMDDFSELVALGANQLLVAGLSLEGDDIALSRAAGDDVQQVMLAVKSWEPPMSELSDFLTSLRGKSSCELFLKPLKGGAIDDNALLDWQLFAEQQDDGGIPVYSLTPAQAANPSPPPTIGEAADGSA